MPGPLVVPIALGLGQILSNVFGNLWGAKKQSDSARDAAEIQSRTALQLAAQEREALDKQLTYMERIDARDYADWLAREARDRTDWEAGEQRKAPYRALGDSAIRTLADYIRVPGMRPAQEVPVQQWRAQPPSAASGSPVNSTMPVGGDFRQFLPTDPTMFASPDQRRRVTFADFARG